MSTYTLKYSYIPDIPAIGYVFYLCEVVLIRLKRCNTIYISGKEKKFVPLIFKILFSPRDSVICQTTQFGHVLKHIPATVILNLSLSEAATISEANYYDYLFTLVSTDVVSKKSLKILGKIEKQDWKTLF